MRSSKRTIRAGEHPSQLGGKVGPRIARIVSDAMADHQVRSAHHRSRIAAEGANEFFRGMGREKLTHLTPLLSLYQNAEGAPPELQKVIRFMAHGQGELSELLSTLATAQGLSTPIGAAIANWLAPTNQFYIEQAPHSLLGVAQVAQALRSGWIGPDWATSEAAKGGLDSYRFAVLSALAIQWPALGELIEMLRRGHISVGDATVALERQGMNPAYIPHLLAQARQNLAPADLALMALRGIIGEDFGREVAARSGYTAGDFDLLVAATGEPPGLMQLLEAYRRGFIGAERLERGIKQSRVRDEWIDVVERLRFVPADTSDAVRGVVQHQLSDAEGRQIAEWNGLRPEDWGWLVRTAGNPPSPGELYQLWNRAMISRADVEQGLRESHLKDKWIPHVLALHRRLPQERQIVSMVSRGALTVPAALNRLHELGFDAADSKALVESGIHATTDRERTLTVGQVTTALQEGLVSAAEAQHLLEALGLHGEAVRLVLMLAELKQEITYRRAAVGGIRTAYIGRHIDHAKAMFDLEALGLAAGQRDHLLALWSVDRDAHRKTLTEAQIIKANVADLLTDHEAEERLLGLGYDLTDAQLLLDSEKGRRHPAP
jgi:hypothetical protein